MITIFDDAVILISCLMSVMGTTYVITNYLMNATLLDTAFKFVYNLSISNLIQSTTILLNIMCIVINYR